MKRKAALMLAMLLVVGMTFSTVATATEVEVAVSENEVSQDPVEEEQETEEPVEEETSEEETPAEEPAEEPDVAAPAGAEADPEEETIEVVEGSKKVSGGGALAVDGYYDDWEGVPETSISYKSHNREGTVYEYHGGSILVSGGYVYVHIRMNDLYQQQIPIDDLKLTINWDQAVYSLSQGIHSDLGIFFRDGGQVALGEAAVTVSEATPNDSFEFRMKISELEPLYGFEPGTIENGAKLEFFSPNIGPEKVTVVGSSTGTYIGVLLCFAVVLAALWGQKRKQARS